MGPNSNSVPNDLVGWAGQWGRDIRAFVLFSQALGRVVPRSLDAHCTRHGSRCTCNRTISGNRGKGRPLGFLVAWLLAGCDKAVATKDDHVRLKKPMGADLRFFTWEFRKRCRETIERDPLWISWLDDNDCHERPLIRASEPREPEELQ